MESSGVVQAVEFQDLVQELQNSLCRERQQLKGILQNLLETQSQHQEEIILRFVEKVHGCTSLGTKQAALGSLKEYPDVQGQQANFQRVLNPPKRVVNGSSGATVEPLQLSSDASEGRSTAVGSNGQWGGRSGRLRDLQRNLGQIESRGATTGSLQSDADVASITSFEVKDNTSMLAVAYDHTKQIELAIAPLSRAVQRVEALMYQQDKMSTVVETLERVENMLISDLQTSEGPLGLLPAPSKSNLAESERPDENDLKGSEEALECEVGSIEQPAHGESRRSEAFRRSQSMSSWQLQSEHASTPVRLFYQKFSRQIEWWAGLKEPEREGILPRIVLSSAFETVCALGIVMNMVFLMLITDYEMANGVGPDYQEGSDICFLVFFSVELFCRLACHRQYFFCNDDMCWNCFDTLLVVTGFIELALSSSGSAAVVRPLRSFKLAKILRGARLMRFFSELSVMLNSLLGSLVTLFWSFVMLALLFYLFAIVLVQGLATFLSDNPGFEGSSEEAAASIAVITEDFGSVGSTMLSLYKTTFGGDDWSVFYNPISVTGPVNSLVFIVFVALMHIAMLNILTGIFVESALKLAQPDRDMLAMRQRMDNIKDAEDFKALFNEIRALTPCPDGYITTAAFDTATHTGRLVAHMEVLGLSIKECNSNLFFATCTDPNGMQLKDFLERCMDLRGDASSLDLHAVLEASQQVHRDFKFCLSELAKLSAGRGRRTPFVTGQSSFKLKNGEAPAYTSQRDPFKL